MYIFSVQQINWMFNFFCIYGSSGVYAGDVYVMTLAEEITAAFRRFGPLVVDWPHKAESKSYFPPKGKHAVPKVLSSLLYKLVL